MDGYFFWLNLISSMIRPMNAMRKIPNCNMVLISSKRRLLSKDLIDTIIGITLLILRLATIDPTCLHWLLYRCSKFFKVVFKYITFQVYAGIQYTCIQYARIMYATTKYISQVNKFNSLLVYLFTCLLLNKYTLCVGYTSVTYINIKNHNVWKLMKTRS